MRKKPKAYKLVVFVPQSHLENVRIAVCQAGAGKIGHYDNCTFITAGIGTFRPLEDAKPFIGEKGMVNRVGEARLETVVPAGKIKTVLAALRKVHPYEEPSYDVYQLLTISPLIRGRRP